MKFVMTLCVLVLFAAGAAAGHIRDNIKERRDARHADKGGCGSATAPVSASAPQSAAPKVVTVTASASASSCANESCAAPARGFFRR